MKASRGALQILCLFLTLMILIVCTYGSAGAAIWRVDSGSGTDPADCMGGDNWSTAFQTIQKAVSCSSNGDEIWLKGGTYYLSSTIYVNRSVEIYGGFDGAETVRDQRDWVNNVTTVDGQGTVDHCFSLSSSATLDGFTITGGNANGESLWDDDGGGILIRSGNITIRNCSFSNNYASGYGGGIFNDSGFLSISNCSFFDNSCAAWGGAICLWQWSEGAIISNCSFARNSAIYGGAIGDGSSGNYPVTSITNCDFTDNSAKYGGAFRGRNNAVTIGNCLFYRNSAENSGGAIDSFNSLSSVPGVITDCLFLENHADRGGGIYQYTSGSGSETDINRCFFQENSATDGGGIYNYSIASSQVNITNCILFGNSADRQGAGLQNSFDDSANVSIFNCTFSANRANSNGSGIYNTGPYQGTATDVVKITNCILWEDLGNEIGNYHNIPIVNYSDIQGGYSGEGNINVNPLFIGNGDLHLTSPSPCIDAGISSGAPSTDFEGDPRPQGNGYDMGADEFTFVPVAADFTANPTSGVEPLSVDFTDQSAGNINSWNWAFGDGATSPEKNPSYTYQDPGTFSVSLTVSGPGGTDTETKVNLINVEVLDSDDDGLGDELEDTTCSDSLDADSDDDGILDGEEDANKNGVVDAGETNPCNGDTDGDGIQDGTELGLTLADIGPDTNIDVFQPDLDPTTTSNPLDSDTDDDAFNDGREDQNHNGRIDPGESDPIDPASQPEVKAMPWIPLLLLED